MNSLSFVVLAAAVAVASAGFLSAPVAPVVALAGPAVYPSHAVAPLALPHPISYAAPAYTKFSYAAPLPVVYAAPAVKTIAYAAPVVKTVAYAAPVVKTLAPVAPVYSAGHGW